MSDKLATMIHVTGVQRSGHSFIGRVLTVNNGISWWKQHDAEPWIVKLEMASTQLNCIFPGLEGITSSFPTGPGTEKLQVFETRHISESSFEGVCPPSAFSLYGLQINDSVAVRVTEYASPEWFHKHIPSQSSGAAMHINVVRDPRNLLASAIGKGWDEQHCSDLMRACEFQYSDPVVQSYTNISYERTLSDIVGDGTTATLKNKKSVAGIVLNDWAMPSILASQTTQTNSSFDAAGDTQEYSERYKRPDIIANPIFQSLFPKAEDIYKKYHIPFLASV